MGTATVQLIMFALAMAEKVAFSIGGKIVEVNTSDMTDPAVIQKAFADAAAEGFPSFQFTSTAKDK